MSEKEQENKPDPSKVKFLSDAPELEDKFAGGSHERTGKALFNLIKDSSEGGFAIGLEGGWGSGKSTVINIAEQKIKEEESKNKNEQKHIFYTFDAWAHQDDPIKRSFLECLLRYLNNIKEIKLKSWVKEIRAIKSQQQITYTQNTPEVPSYVYIMAIFGLIFPFLIISAHYSLSQADVSNNWFWYSIILAVGAPLIYSLIEFGFRKYRKTKFENTSVLPSIQFLSQQTKNNQQVYTQNHDSTTIEFNKHFFKILSHIKKNDKRLVVVIDNLDRLPSDELKDFWSSMRNFFTTEAIGEEADLIKNVFLIVPYDKKQISNTFNDEGNENEKVEGGFIEKTFKLSLHVSEPILVDWKKYFDNLLLSTFGNERLDPDTSHALYKFMDSYFINKQVRVTPRRIKSFINEVIVLHKKWGNDIPIKYLGLYVANKEIMKKAQYYSASTLLNQKSQREVTNDKDWIKYYLAIYFNVPPENALHVNLFSPISKGIKEGNDKYLEELQKNDGFELVFDEVLENNDVFDDWVGNEDLTINQWLSLSYLNLSPERNKRVKDKVVFALNNLHNGALLLKAGARLFDGFSSLIQFLKYDKYFFSLIPNKVVESYNNKDELKEDPYNENLSNFLLNLVNLAKKEKGSQELQEIIQNIQLPEGKEFSYELAIKLKNDEEIDDIYIFSFSLSYSHEDFWDYLKELLNEGIPEELHHVVNHVIKDSIDITESLEGLAETLGEKINQLINGGNENPLIYNLLPVLIELKHKGSEKSQSIINNLVNNNKILIVLGFKNIDSGRNRSLLSQIIYEIAVTKDVTKININEQPVQNFNPGFQFLTKILKAQDPFDNIKEEMAKVASEQYNHETFDLALNKDDRFNCFQEIAKELVTQGRIDCNELGFFIKKYEELHFLDETLKKTLLKNLDEKCADFDLKPEIRDISPQFLRDSFESANNLFKKLAETVSQILLTYSKEDWDDVFKNQKLELDIIESLVNKDYKEFLGLEFRDAIFTAYKDIITEELDFANIEGYFPWCLEALSTNFQQPLFSNIQKDFSDDYRDKNTIEDVFELFDSENFVTLHLDSNKYDQFVQNILVPMMDGKDMASLNWIIRVLNQNNKLRSNYLNENSIGQIEDRVRNQLSQIEEPEESTGKEELNPKELLKEIALKFDIDLSESKEEKNDQNDSNEEKENED